MTASNDPADEKGLVVLLHGHGGKWIWMLPFQFRLRQFGYRSVIWSYPSWRGSVAAHGDRLRAFLLEHSKGEQRIHIVAHSMGSIVVRSALSCMPIATLGRVVFLAPPNRGSPVAFGVKRLVGTAFQTIADIASDPTSFVNSLPEWENLELGIIAARFDVLIPVSNTHLLHESDHVVVNATHNTLLFSPRAMRLATDFLETGRFERVAGSGGANRF